MRRAAPFLFLLLLAACRPSAPPLDDFGVVPAFTLTSQDGQPFHASSLDGHVWIADFIYTSCAGACPRMTSQMREVQTALAPQPDIRLVSFTVDPANDTPERLAAYAKQNRANPAAWTFLTGPPDTLQKLDRDAFKLGNVDATMQHSSRFVLMDRHRHIRGYYETSESDAITRLLVDIQRLEDSQS